MFENIEQLEKEVKEFQQNILASTELVTSIKNIISAIKAQEEDFATKSLELISKLDSNIDAFHISQENALSKLGTSQEDALSRLVAENQALIKELTAKGDALLKDMNNIPLEVEKYNAKLVEGFNKSVAELIESSNSVNSTLQAETEAFGTKCDELLQSMSEVNRVHLSNTSDTISQAQQAYLQKVEASEASIKHCEVELNRKYEDFLSKLKSTNVDQMFKMCEEIKKSMDAKFLLLFIGLGASVALVAVSFFI